MVDRLVEQLVQTRKILEECLQSATHSEVRDAYRYALAVLPQISTGGGSGKGKPTNQEERKNLDIAPPKERMMRMPAALGPTAHGHLYRFIDSLADEMARAVDGEIDALAMQVHTLETERDNARGHACSLGAELEEVKKQLADADATLRNMERIRH